MGLRETLCPFDCRALKHSASAKKKKELPWTFYKTLLDNKYLGDRTVRKDFSFCKLFFLKLMEAQWFTHKTHQKLKYREPTSSSPHHTDLSLLSQQKIFKFYLYLFKIFFPSMEFGELVCCAHYSYTDFMAVFLLQAALSQCE